MTRASRTARGATSIALAVVALVLAGARATAQVPTASEPAPAPTATIAAPTPSATAATPGPSPSLHPVDVGGVLFVSGVRTKYHPSRDPLGGTLHVELTVRNASAWTVDASAEIGARTLLGLDLGADGTTDVRDLRPGEVRVLSKDIEGVGQWAVLEPHVTLTPPHQVGGTELEPLTRERWVLAPPWQAIALVAALGIVAWVLRRSRLRLVPRRARGRSGASRPAVVR